MPTITIGRGSASDIRLDDQTVSRRHAEAELLASGEIELRDLSSTNGLFLERGGRIVRTRCVTLASDDTVILGAARLDSAQIESALRHGQPTAAASEAPKTWHAPNDPNIWQDAPPTPSRSESRPRPQKKGRGRPRRDPITNELRYDD